MESLDKLLPHEFCLYLSVDLQLQLVSLTIFLHKIIVGAILSRILMRQSMALFSAIVAPIVA